MLSASFVCQIQLQAAQRCAGDLSSAIMNLIIIFLVGVQSVLQLFVMMSIGVFFQRGMNLMGFGLRKELSTIIFQLGLPCLLLSKTAFSIDLSNLTALFILPFFCVVHVSAAYVFSVIGERFVSQHFSYAFHEGHYKASSMLGKYVFKCSYQNLACFGSLGHSK